MGFNRRKRSKRLVSQIEPSAIAAGPYSSTRFLPFPDSSAFRSDRKSRPLLFLRLLCFLLFIFSTSTAHSADIVRAAIEKKNAWTGEAVPLVITLYSPGPFSGTASFALPELPRTAILKVGNPVVGSEVVDGETWFTQRHEFKLYTQQSGEVVVPAFAVRFKGKKTFTSHPEPMTGTTPEIRFQSNRPPGTEKLGVVIATTQMDVEQTWTPKETDSVNAGDVLQRTITRTAVGTTAMMMPPASSNAPDGIRVYTSDPIVEDKTARGASSAVRSEILKYQFQQAGTYELPELSFAWWDAQAEELKRDRMPGKTVNVAGVVTEREVSETVAAKADGSRWPVVAWILGIGLIAWFCHKLFKKLVGEWQTKRNSPQAAAARRVEAGCRLNDASAAYAALLDWKRAILSSGTRSEERFTQTKHQTGLHNEWDALSSYVFGAQPGNTMWSGRRLNAVFAKSRAAFEEGQYDQSETSVLPDLNPKWTLS